MILDLPNYLLLKLKELKFKNFYITVNTSESVPFQRKHDKFSLCEGRVSGSINSSAPLIAHSKRWRKEMVCFF